MDDRSNWHHLATECEHSDDQEHKSVQAYTCHRVLLKTGQSVNRSNGTAVDNVQVRGCDMTYNERWRSSTFITIYIALDQSEARINGLGVLG